MRELKDLEENVTSGGERSERTMKPWVFGIVALLLVPFQITLIDLVSPFGIRPDVCFGWSCV